MPLGLYMDVHIPRAVTNGLRRRGVDVITAQQDDSATLDDSQLLDRSTALNRTLYTQDVYRNVRSDESSTLAILNITADFLTATICF